MIDAANVLTMAGPRQNFHGVYGAAPGSDTYANVCVSTYVCVRALVDSRYPH
jgi:hypothetical protein